MPMKIGIIGDTHFGYQWGTERSIDSFLQAQDAFEKACKAGCDVIVQVGDLFDTRVPKPEVISEAMKLLSVPLLAKPSNVKLVNTFNKNIYEISDRIFQGIPLVAIHGTHDRRSRGLINPLESFEQAGFLIHLHRNAVVFEKENERVAIHGFSGVPERYAGENFSNWDPKPVPNASNIMLLHQSFSEYIYSPLEPPTMNIEMLPVGFDLFINGHIHCSDVKDLQNKGMFLLSGSTLITQITKPDTERPKYIWYFDTKTKELTKEKIDQVRKVFLEEMDVTNLSILEIKEKLISYLKSLPKNDIKKPLVKIKLIGKLSKGIDSSELTDISEYMNKFLVTIDKRFDNELTIEKLRTLHEVIGKRRSSEEIGIEMLQSDLSDEVTFDIESLFKLLTEGSIDKALENLKEVSNDQTIRT